MITKKNIIIGICIGFFLLVSIGIAQIISNRDNTTLAISSDDSITIKNRYNLNTISIDVKALPCDDNYCYFKVYQPNFINENIRVAKLNRTGAMLEGEIDRKVNERLQEIAEATRLRTTSINSARDGRIVEGR